MLWLVAFFTPWGQESFAGVHLPIMLQKAFGWLKFALLILCFICELVLICFAVRERKKKKARDAVKKKGMVKSHPSISAGEG